MFGGIFTIWGGGGATIQGKGIGFRVACKGVQGFSFEVYMLGVQNAAKNPTTIYDNLSIHQKPTYTRNPRALCSVYSAARLKLDSWLLRRVNIEWFVKGLDHNHNAKHMTRVFPHDGPCKSMRSCWLAGCQHVLMSDRGPRSNASQTCSTEMKPKLQASSAERLWHNPAN